MQQPLPFAPREVPAGPPAPSDPFVVCLRHPRARRYVIRVTDEGHVRVTIPPRGSRKGALAFVDSQREWIDKQRRRLERERNACDEREGREDGLRARARRELPERLLELAARYHLHVRRISIRNQKWRWGSCSSSGHICLNWRLVEMPDAVRDYVLIHELMHLKRMDHSQKFWNLVARACPDYRELRRQLSAFRRQPSGANRVWTAPTAGGRSALEHTMQVDPELGVASCAADGDRDRAAAARPLEQRIDDFQQQRFEPAHGL
jgi:predicted metal-dependent hydrolase